MISSVTCNRDPFPNPKLENDEDFAKQKKQKAVNTDSVYLDQQVDPWNRLNATPTLQSSRNNVFHHDPLAPNDSLDFILNAVYNHTTGYMKKKNEVFLQKETLEDIGRKLKNREKVEPVVISDLEHPLKVVEIGKMEDFNSIKLAIESHHTQITNRGFSRKPDGGYFST